MSDTSVLRKWRQWVLGAPRNPLEPETRSHVSLAAFLAWVGLGADGLSSSAYGPEEGFLALGAYTHLGLYLAVATAVTVFLISLAYNQVIELFPSGGGGYKVATTLLGPHAGLVSGSALMVDYVLTIAISVASGMDAVFSFMPLSLHFLKFSCEILTLIVLIVLNMRGMRETITILMPIFLGFFLTHVLLIVYGIAAHATALPDLIPATIGDTHKLVSDIGAVAAISLFLRAYSMGAGTYTGIEAVSNNVNTLAEPRVTTGKLTMFYMATSLSFVAGGIILLYLLWGAAPVPGQTLNAVVFDHILGAWHIGDWVFGQQLLLIVLALEAGLLFVAANTGFLGGPAVLANMAADCWVPQQFSHLSNRLVTQNGVLLMGVAALGILAWTGGQVSLLVILYSINVFITFTMSLLGLCVYWWTHRATAEGWIGRLALSFTGLLVTAGILVVTVVEKFGDGGWMTLLITGFVVGVCLLIKRHYQRTDAYLRQVDALFGDALRESKGPPPAIDPDQPTAVLFVTKNRGYGLHTLLWVRRLFPDHFRNFVFVTAGEVDSRSFAGDAQLDAMQQEVAAAMDFYVRYCHSHGLAAECRVNFGTDPVEQLTEAAEAVRAQFPNSVFFASKLVYLQENWLTRLLHDKTPVTLQRMLHLQGMQMMILPMKVG